MNCWTCDRPSHAICQFCGRAVCRDHVSTLPAILAAFTDPNSNVQALVAPDAVHCGTCKPKGKPVKLDGLEAWAASPR